MKTIITFFIFSFVVGSAFADEIKGVSVLDLKYIKGSFEVKLQIKDAKKDAFFLVDIVKEDEKAFDKLALVLKKMNKKESFQLNLDIKSFSPYPSGSYYRSTSVKFIGSAENESLLDKKGE